ncbi:MAG: SufS family cysteine desulfurase [bacterium]|nr:SufS family cysteine desulfurase [bacterium]
MLDTKKIKKDFPIFERYEKAHGKPLVYLDSAATSQTPRQVVEAMDEYYYGYRSNVHRSPYDIGAEATSAYEAARETIARFIGAKGGEMAFTSGATGSANMLALMLGRELKLRAGDELLASIAEHHSNFVPFQELAKAKGASFKTIPIRGADLDYEAAARLISERTKLVTLPLAGNVLGTVHDLSPLIRKAKAVGALTIVDATKAAGHMPIDVKKLGADFLFFSGHKMLGPTGIGVLYGRREFLEALTPAFSGGGTVEKVTAEHSSYKTSPLKFEAGTPNVAGAIGLAHAVAYLEALGVENVQRHTEELVRSAVERLSRVKEVRIISEKDEKKNIGIVSFVVEGMHPHDVAELIGREGVAIRGGHHCAMPLMASLGVPGVCRASFYIYNGERDIVALVTSVEKAIAAFKQHG